MSVGYPGRDGAHSAAACDRLFPGGAELVALPSFSAVADAAAEGVVEFGVLPIESSLSGPVAEAHDLLYDSALAITGETVLPIRHCLVGPTQVEMEEIRVVHSHPAALDQCRRLLAAMPWTTAIAAATTADAAAHVAERADPAEAAISSERAATLYGLTVIAGDVGDHPEAYTRFVSIATYIRLDTDGERWRTAFSFVTDHQPGALHQAIEPFARHRIDLVQLVSRPPDPAVDVALPLRRGARGSPTRPRRAQCSCGRRRAHSAAARLRLLPSRWAAMNGPGSHGTIRRSSRRASTSDRSTQTRRVASELRTRTSPFASARA